MAIIQISKIQQRSGNLVDLPQLDEAQFGWASDAKRLFIGKTTPNENVEVLTSYSNISFSQIEGSGGANFNVTTPITNGQVLTYVSSTNTWNNWPNQNILTANSSFKLNLGDVGNIKMSGGSTGFVLQTDGLGNISWTPKTTIVANIQGLSNDPTGNIITMTVANTTPYTNGTEITISGVNGVSNSNVNSTNFYVKLASNFPTTGNVTLYTDSGLTVTANGVGLTYTNSPNALAITTVGGTSTLVAAGSNTSIQFNNGGTLQGSPYFTILNGNGLLTHSGPYFAVGNVYANSGTVGANILTGTLSTNAQPNVTSVGTLTSVSVSGNANVGNLNTAGTVIASQVTANSNGLGTNFKVGDDAFIGDVNVTNTMVIKGQQDGANGFIVFGNADTTSTLGRAGTGPLTYLGAFSATGNGTFGNVSATTFTGNLSGNATTAGTVITGAQPNITSTGTLAGLVVAGNITPSANITYNLGNNTNRFNDLYLAGSTIYIGAQTISANATSVTISGNLVSNIAGNATTAGTVTTNAQPNITSVGTLTSLSVSGNANIGNIGTGGLITATGNINGGNIITAGIVSATGNGTFGNVSATTFTGELNGAATTAGTVTTAAQPNITSVGTLTSLSVSGNANVGNLGATGNIISNNSTISTTASVGGLLLGPSDRNANFNVAVANTGYIAGIKTGPVTYTDTGSGGTVAMGAINSLVAPTVQGVTAATIYTNLATLYVSNAPTIGSSITVSNRWAVYVGGGSSYFGGNVTMANVITGGLITATGNITGGNITTSGAGSLTTTSITTGANTTAGTITGNWSLSAGSKLTSTYADLAEYYTADQKYEPGTVLAFGGEKEVTIAEDGTNRVAGVVSTDPAYGMNAKCPGIAVAIALQGRVPTKVRGTIRKGDMMVSGGNGFARPCSTPQMGTVIGKALENFDGIEGVIEIAVGRL